MVYRNLITGLEIVTDCYITAPNIVLVSAPTPKVETPPAEKSGESLVIEDKPKKKTTKRAKK